MVVYQVKRLEVTGNDEEELMLMVRYGARTQDMTQQSVGAEQPGSYGKEWSKEVFGKTSKGQV